jgi:hypothetical protein
MVEILKNSTQKIIRQPYEELNWNGNFIYPNMVRIRTIGDGSCFFHAIISSFYIPYRTGKLNNKPFNRIDFVKRFRSDLAVRLAQKVDPRDKNGLTYYESLSRGQLKELSKDLPQYSLESMQKELTSGMAVDNIYNEFISNVIDKDIYILDMIKRDVYFTGNDEDILFKKRNSIVILYTPGHYELIGIIGQDQTIISHFDTNHSFIQYILQKYREKIPTSSNNKNIINL